jgi:PhnB protein
MPANIEFPISDETKKLVLHSELDVFGGKIMFSDVPENLPYNVGNNVSIVITTNNMDEARSTFERLSEGGLVTMDLQETFWSKLYGMVTDQFGVNWQISHAA